MKKRGNKKSLSLIIVLIVGLFILFILISLNKKPQELPKQYVNQPQIQNSKFKTHTSQDLKISFKYPRGWYVDDRNYTVLLTNYLTSLNSNDHPNSNQIEIIIREASLCQDTIEKNLIYGGCGENQKILNKILNKQIEALSSGTFYKYTVQYPGHTEQMFYFLQKGGNILKLSKHPDPSQFEKEFEEIVNSIRFL